MYWNAFYIPISRILIYIYSAWLFNCGINIICLHARCFFWFVSEIHVIICPQNRYSRKSPWGEGISDFSEKRIGWRSLENERSDHVPFLPPIHHIHSDLMRSRDLSLCRSIAFPRSKYSSSGSLCLPIVSCGLVFQRAHKPVLLHYFIRVVIFSGTK